MKMNVFEYTVTAKEQDIAGFENPADAIAFARHIANEQHCDVVVINAFTGEVCYEAYVIVRVTYNAYFEELSRDYEIKEKKWAD